ncbi:MAG: hypothetical protein RMX96_11810 [Nostoc sp. ChiSLP02]|nr:hypothetical protein [Nostoc sp. DedSLP05]MDZ8103494.1 hypothetical protein [Nostoc sp. DedSLP01]MDZ8185526.1 hypothetical protein [Nostoc sp. ChiSLP02]
MANKINGSDTFSSLESQVDLELLEALLEPEDATYPWDPTNEESEAYFQELEQQFGISDLIDEDLTRRSQDFYSHLDTLWSGVYHSETHSQNLQQSLVLNLQEILRDTFYTCVPKALLNDIAAKAAEIFSSRQLRGEQLVECVQSVLPTWAAEDLLVLARPYAFAMRSSESHNPTSVMSNLNNSEWTNLSEIEQAKISLAIAYYALTQLEKYKSES